MLTFNFILVVILIIATAFFVATEFAIVRVRPTRVNQMVMEGKKGALSVQRVTGDLDGYLAACQLGITITAMGLGWLGEPTIETVLLPLLERFDLPQSVITALSFLVAFLVMTYLHVVFGELAPKTLAIQKAEEVSLWLAKPIILFYKLMYPLIWLLNGSAFQFVRLFGLKPAKEHEEAHSEEELRIILSESYKSGTINESEYGYMNNIFAFDELLAREIMVPRTDMVSLDISSSTEAVFNIIKSETFTRFPVTDGDKDHIVGILNTKQFYMAQHDHPDISLNQLLQPVLAVPEVTPVNQLLKKMQKQHQHLAILLDEYGGTSGMITIEDILEEIVGEIRDEFDNEETPEIEQINENQYVVDGKVPITTINQLLHVEIDADDIDSIGGWLYHQHAALRSGGTWTYHDLEFTILEKSRHRIRKIRIDRVTMNSDKVEENGLLEA